MLRREFLKFASLLGVAVTVPGATTVAANPALENKPIDGVFYHDNKPSDIVITFKWEGREIAFLVEEGDLTFQENIDIDFVYKQGVLEGSRESHKMVDFDLSFRTKAIHGSEILQDALKHRGRFDLVAKFKDEQVTFCSSHMDNIEYDLSQGLFRLQGRCMHVNAPADSHRGYKQIRVERINS